LGGYGNKSERRLTLCQLFGTARTVGGMAQMSKMNRLLLCRNNAAQLAPVRRG
jgi:hypothetical protein